MCSTCDESLRLSSSLAGIRLKTCRSVGRDLLTFLSSQLWSRVTWWDEFQLLFLDREAWKKLNIPCTLFIHGFNINCLLSLGVDCLLEIINGLSKVFLPIRTFFRSIQSLSFRNNTVNLLSVEIFFYAQVWDLWTWLESSIKRAWSLMVLVSCYRECCQLNFQLNVKHRHECNWLHMLRRFS